MVLYVGRGLRGNSAACSVLGQVSVTSYATQKQIGPFSCWFPCWWVCVHSRTLWVSPTNSPVRLGASPSATTHTGFCSWRLWGFICPCWNPGFLSLSPSPLVPPSLTTGKCGTTCSASRHLLWWSNCSLSVSPLHPGCPFPTLLLVLVNVSSVTPWLSDFHTVRLSGSSVLLLLLFCF